MPRCDTSTRSRTWSIGTSPPSRATGCAATCREGAVAARARRALLFDGGRRHQVVRVRPLPDRGDPRSGGDAGDPRADPRVASRLELARRAGRRRVRGGGSPVRVREQADDGRQHRLSPGDQSAVRGGVGPVAPGGARDPGRLAVHGRAGTGAGAAVRGGRAATVSHRAGAVARERAGCRECGGVGVHGHGVPLARAPTERTWRRPWSDRGRRHVRQPDRVSGLPAGCASARGGSPHRLGDRDLPRRIPARARLRVPVARDHPGTRARGVAVLAGRAGAESRVGVARARRNARPAGGDRGRRDPGRDGAQVVARHGRGGRVSDRIIRTYFAITGLFNLAMSLIWGIDTLFKMGAGLDIQQVLLTNAAFTLGSMVFEVPTGVVADTVGRRVSLLLCLVTLFVTTLLYVAIAWRGGGFWAFMWVSVFLGLGYTFYTGAVDAWLVDALKASGYDEPLERVFSRGQMLFGAAMLVGTIGGGLLGQIRLDIPYLVRAALVVPLFVLAWRRMPELGFTPRALELKRVPAELRRVFVEGLRHGLSNPVIRPVMLASLVSMSFMIFGYYSWQRYFLDLLGRDLVWVDGVVSALVGLSLIVGNALVAPLSRVVRTRTGLLMVSAGAQAVLAVACGLITNFFAVVSLYLVYGVAIGVAMPVKQAYLNAHIPSAQRATIISLDSMFASSGGVLGQTAWGWVARTRSIGTAWAWSGLTLLLGIPLYWMARRRDRTLDVIS